MEYIRSMYSSSFLRLISRLEPIHKTKGQLSLSDIFLSLLIPIPEYAAASSKVKLLFSQTGISIIDSILHIHRFAVLTYQHWAVIHDFSLLFLCFRLFCTYPGSLQEQNLWSSVENPPYAAGRPVPALSSPIPVNAECWSC